MDEVATRDVCWADLGVGRGREQSGLRPVVVVVTPEYLDAVDSLAIVVPVTSRGREWPNHVALTGDTGLARPSWAMTEQPRTIARTRLVRLVGAVDRECLDRIRVYLRDFLDF
jgi:mRNA interferase MazF